MSKTTKTILLTTGILLVVFSFWLASGPQNATSGAKVGKISVERGQVWTLPAKQARTLLNKRGELHLNEQVESGPDSEALLELDSKYRIRLLENSLIAIELEADKTVLQVFHGQINFETYGTEGTLIVAEGGRRVTPLLYSNLAQPDLVDIDQTNAATSSEVAAFSAQTSPADSDLNKNKAATSAGGPLSEDAIHQTLKTYSPAFFKCYANVLQKNNGSQEVTMTFTIESSGKITQPEVMRSTVDDEDFKKCLKEAFRRVEFKPFNGKSFQTVYPIRFE